MGTLHCMLENGTSIRRYDTRARSAEEEEECQIAIFYFAWCVRNMAMLYSFDWKSAVEHDGGV